MRVLAGALAAATLALGGCASIPLSTAIRLSHLDAESLSAIDPSEVEVKASVPKGYTIDVARSQLTLSVSDSHGASRAVQMHLQQLKVTHGSRGGGWFSSAVPVTTYWLGLTEEGVNELRHVQRFARQRDPKTFKFGVSVPFATCPPHPKQVRFWADLRLAEGKPFMSLIDGYTFAFPEGARCS